jgi:hypothetical protein
MKQKYILIYVFLVFFFNISEYAVASEQWNSGGTNSISGYVCNAKENTDNTVGCEAFNDIGLKKHTRNIDIGGGKFDQNTEYLKKEFDIENLVYDPFNRSVEHNKLVLSIAHYNPFDTATSMSVLNVIDTKKARLEHIKLMFDCIHNQGAAYFKVYKGNGSGKGKYGKNRYQSNNGVEFYFSEIASVFGRKNTKIFPKLNLIVAIKNP